MTPFRSAERLPVPLLAAGILAGMVPGLVFVEGTAAAGLAGCIVALGLLLARGRHEAARYGVFALRIALALPLLAGGLLLLRQGLLAQALGVAWIAGGLGLALGLLAPWAGLYAALALPLAIPLGGSGAWAGLGLAALALAFTDDDTLALDAPLRRRGGLFPTLRTEVVLAPLAAAEPLPRAQVRPPGPGLGARRGALALARAPGRDPGKTL